MLLTPIDSGAQTRSWCSHGDVMPGVHREHFADHEDAERLGAFVRITAADERLDEALHPLEQPAYFVRRTCEPKTLKRQAVAFAPNRCPFPDWYDADPDESWRRPLTPEIVSLARRL
ncbi:MAG: hypothetical protein ACKO1N_11825 [Erythrobacter sp.]